MITEASSIGRKKGRRKKPSGGRLLFGFEPVILDISDQNSVNGHSIPRPRTPEQIQLDISRDQRILLSKEQIVTLSQQLLTLKDLSEQTRSSLEFSAKYYPVEHISDEMIVAASRHSLFMVRQAHDRGELSGVRIQRLSLMNPEKKVEKPKVDRYKQNCGLVEKATQHPVWQEVPSEDKTFLNLTFLHSGASTRQERIDAIQEMAEMMGSTEMEVRVKMKHWLNVFQKVLK